MKRLALKARFLFCMVQLGWLIPLTAQNPALDFIYGGIDDAEVILREYLMP